MIRNIQLRHAGKYTCAVQTKVDSSSIAIDLIVRGENLKCSVMIVRRKRRNVFYK